MRILAIGAALLALASCTTTSTESSSPFQQPNSLMAGEISRRVEQIPYQHREELLQNLVWLANTGEQTIPSLLTGLQHENPKVRSSCAWVLGQLKDRRTIPNLQEAMRDSEPAVKMELARTLVTMGDMTWSTSLIEGLDSERKEVRFLCHEALKTATGHDFGYDHLNQSNNDMRVSVLRWRQWWSEYSGDVQFAQVYQRQHNLQPQVAAPAGEIQPQSAQDAGNGSQEQNAPVQVPTNEVNPAAENPAQGQNPGGNGTSTGGRSGGN